MEQKLNDVLIMELFVGLGISFVMLGFMIWAIKTGQFDDSEKQNSGLLFDTKDVLNDAINKENKRKSLEYLKHSSKNTSQTS